MKLFMAATSRYARKVRMERMHRLPVVGTDHERIKKAMAELHSLAEEYEGPDGRIHWRNSRLEWPIRHGFIDLIAREFHAGKMMFPPDASSRGGCAMAHVVWKLLDQKGGEHYGGTAVDTTPL